MEKIETLQFAVDAFNTDFAHNLNYSTLGRDLLNTADFHASRRGFGIEMLSAAKRSWVLSRLSIEMNRMPQLNEHYAVDTWIENIYRMFTNRNFCVWGRKDDGERTPLGYARSIWAMIDNDSRQPLDLARIYGEQFQQWLFPENECPIDGHSRIRPMDVSERKPMMSHKVIYSDVDCNCHVNSIKYIEHICNLFSLDYYRDHFMKRIEVAYVAEAYFGDTLHFYIDELEENRFQIEIVKEKGNAVGNAGVDTSGTVAGNAGVGTSGTVAGNAGVNTSGTVAVVRAIVGFRKC